MTVEQILFEHHEQAAQIASLKSRILDLERDGERLDWVLKELNESGGVLNLVYLNPDQPQSKANIYLNRPMVDLAIASQKPDGGGKGK